MKIVIDIPEEKLGWIKEYPDVYTGWQNEAIRNGTPLPKGHGRLIDADAITKDFNTFQDSFVINFEPTKGFTKIVCTAPTIIEADKDCRNCKKWSECECGEKGHKNGTSIGYSIGECRDYIEADKDED